MRLKHESHNERDPRSEISKREARQARV